MAEILQIRGKGTDDVGGATGLRDEVLAGLSRPAGQRTLPTMLLYNEAGLRLYDAITVNAPEYYLFGAEEDILKKHACCEIVPIMRSAAGASGTSTTIVEMGAGALRKTNVILDAVATSVNDQEPVTYYALDLEERELQRTLEQLETSTGDVLKNKVIAKGLAGTFDDGIRFIEEGGLREEGGGNLPAERNHDPRGASPASGGSDTSIATPTTTPSTPEPEHGPLHLLFLGSSLGNFPRGEDAAFLRSLPLRAGAGDTLLLGLDHDNDAETIEVAYNDPKGYTRDFIMNGLRAAGTALGDESLFSVDQWTYVNNYDTKNRRHEAFLASTEHQEICLPSGEKFAFLPGERVKIEQSHKFSEQDAFTLFSNAGLRPIQRWTDSKNRYSLWLLERPPFSFALINPPSSAVVPTGASPFGVPTMADWETMWSAWDFITLRMIPSTMLFQKPIDLRHICLFYLGHIPTFLDIHLSRLLEQPHTEPTSFKDIFERGIDPNVDDPTQCHSHSEVPQADEEWPSLESILEFRSNVRERVSRLYAEIESGKRQLTRKIARVLFMTHEHEAWHAETLLYMLLQRAGTGTIAPPEFTPPPWESLSQTWKNAPQPASPTIVLGPADVSLGHDDKEADDLSPGGDEAAAGHEFGWDNENPRRTVHVGQFRAEWRPITNGEFLAFFRAATPGSVSFPKSWVESEGQVQVRTLHGPVPMDVAREWPVVSDYNGLSAYAASKGGRLPSDAELRLFYDTFDCGYAGGANVGFRNWHPVPATTGLDKNGGRGHNGGVWEWTSTVFDEFPGFVPSVLYPGYSADFFDGCHNVVVGGSYATIPRLAERRTVRNTYQRNYGYAWTGGRVVYDA